MQKPVAGLFSKEKNQILKICIRQAECVFSIIPFKKITPHRWIIHNRRWSFKELRWRILRFGISERS
jgi:hypothetical protein